MPEENYLEVTAVFGRNGGLTPLSFVWEDQKIQIERVLDVMPATSTKEEGAGYRYTCQAQGRRFFLFFDGERWYIKT